MKLLTLIEIELKKVLPWSLILFAILTVVSGGLIYHTSATVSGEIISNLVNSSVAEYVAENGYVTLASIFDSSRAGFFYILFALLLACFGFLLWYKEWIGQSKRIYMLLSLRGQRFTIVLSKLIVSLTAMFMYYGVILLNLGLGAIILNVVMPDGVVGTELVQGALAQSNQIAYTLPLTLTDFLYKVMFTILMFSMITLFVFLNRSRRVLGTISGVIYFIATISLFVITKTMFLFIDERPLADFAFVLGMTAISFAASYILLNKKISI